MCKNKLIITIELTIKWGSLYVKQNSWRNDLFNSIPKLAEFFCVSVEELLTAQTKQENSKVDDIINIALIGVGFAMGICIYINSNFAIR